MLENYRSYENNVNDGLNSEQKHIRKKDTGDFLPDMELTEDTSCGFWCLKGTFFQKFANQSAYGTVFGLTGLLFAMIYAYFNGIITTLEKRFKISSENIGIIAMGKDLTQMLLAGVLCYYAGGRHRPRWIAFGLFAMVAYCLVCTSLHIIYGPGKDALALTVEYENSSLKFLELTDSSELCSLGDDANDCDLPEYFLMPQVALFVAQFISGIGGALYYTLGVAYLDDNCDKSKTPLLLSLSLFLGLLGPAIGYALASFCLRFYIAPLLTPIINNNDPRWLGAWWMGWYILAITFFVAGLVFTLFPKQLPRAAVRRFMEAVSQESASIAKSETEETQIITCQEDESGSESQTSFKDMIQTFQRLITNKIFMYNNLGRIFYFIGYTPYLMYTPKYIEIQYRQSASTSNMTTGIVPLISSAIGVVISGFIIWKFKPRARYMAAWNVLVCFMTVAGILSYAFIGCPENERSLVVNIPDNTLNNTPTCNSNCHCDYVPYSPVCGENNMTYISPCHAGCKEQQIDANGQKIYNNCACIANSNYSGALWSTQSLIFNPAQSDETGGSAVAGSCPVNCLVPFIIFLAVMSFLNLMGSTGHTSNVLISVRSVSQRDKSAAMGFGMMLICMLTFIPSPIFFGWLLDSMCLVWGKTCTRKGNCWLYDSALLRYKLNIIASVFIIIGALFDCGVWFYVKNLKIFDDEVNEDDRRVVESRRVENIEGEREILY